MIKKEAKKWYQSLGSGIAELIFPPRQLCPVCHQEESIQRGLGRRCLQRIALIVPPICERCGRPLRLAVAHARQCSQCERNQYYFSQARSVALYEGALREYLAELKYRYRPDLGPALGELLVEWAKLHSEFVRKIDRIVSIPIHSQKMMLRGYNQAELLANPLRNYLGIRSTYSIMMREKLTESQNALDKEERFANISGAFRVVDHSGLTGARVLLIDDILTTGATASEAARVLLRGGARDVKVLTLAAGVIDSQWFGSKAGG
ncbi:ComF family protein [Hydrogenispora ethanolica]|uniref:ComF family protein n=1 Tax=Hydrogenispora ethanolica TaxID=1082276 RepID=A0A4V2QDL0_HYDET|nr:ComF family protein [Hydrogenispora ethanolica]TCL64807.1 ComF family protein [Hydrogenispora ethanolica]